ncbi:MAG: hypothetical protein AAF348_07470 [Bacteroidota bacterium]
MSVFIIQMNSRELDPELNFYGNFRFRLTIGAVEYNAILELSDVSGYLKFRRAQHNEINPLQSSSTQASFYTFAVNRDFKNLGEQNNINATVQQNTITVEANIGVFSNIIYSGFALDWSVLDIQNGIQPVTKVFEYERDGFGDCTVERYIATSAQGGVSPYRLTTTDGNLIEDWNGLDPVKFNLLRTKLHTGGLFDSLGALIKDFSQNPTRKLDSNDFTVDIRNYLGQAFSDVTITTAISRSGTEPLEYSLDGNNWQSSNVFGGQQEGNYTAYVRDKYLCAVQKTFVIQDVSNVNESEREVYFKVSEYNSLGFYRNDMHSESVRKNYDNTPSFKEDVGISKTALYRFPKSSQIGTKFNSSYPYHIVTLHKADGSKSNIDFIRIQENLGVIERVDCELFPIRTELNTISGGTAVINNGIGVYFNGGNTYQSGTTDILQSSPYESGLPSWALKGNLVDLDSLGIVEITETNLFDEDRGVLYFKINGTIEERSDIVQVQYDRHPYNVFRFDIDMGKINQNGNFIKIEPGFEFNSVDQRNVHKSEWFNLLQDTSKYLKIWWKGFRNIGEMIFLDNMECEMWIKGRVRPVPSGESEFEDGDDRTRSINQEEYLRMLVDIPVMTPRQWRTFGLVGAIGNKGEVRIQDMKLVRIKPIEHEELGQSNISNISCEFAYASEATALTQQDPVLDVSTGIVGKGGSGTEDVEAWQVDGFRLITEDGLLVQVDGYFVEVD